MERIGRMMETHLSNEHNASVDERHMAETCATEEGSKFWRLEIPIFLEEDPNGWIFRNERYFAVNGVGEAERMNVVIVGSNGLRCENPLGYGTNSRRNLSKDFKIHRQVMFTNR